MRATPQATQSDDQQAVSVAAGSVVRLDTDSFSDFVSSELAIVDFGYEWCSACRSFLPIFEGLAEAHAGAARFGHVDVDDSPSIAARLAIQAPHVVIFSRGTEHARFEIRKGVSLLNLGEQIAESMRSLSGGRR